MLRTRRRIETEEDRYGGYLMGARTPTVNSVDTDDYSLGTIFPIEPENKSFVEPNSTPVAPYGNVPKYLIDNTEKEKDPLDIYSVRSEGGYIIRPYNPKSYVPATMPLRKKRTAKKDREELMPRISRNKSLENERQERAKRDERLKEKSNESRNKVILGIYVALVLILAAVVIGTGVAISGATSRVSALESRNQMLSQELVRQEYEIEMYGNETYLKGRAAENGMENIENAVELETIELKEITVYEERTNWFDRFCDWLGSIF